MKLPVLGVLGACIGILLLAVLFALIFALALVMFCKLGVRVIYDGSLSVIVRVGVIPFNITKLLSRPKKSKKPTLLHFSGEVPFGALPPATKKRARKTATNASGKKTATKKSTPKKKSVSDILDTVRYYTDLVRQASARFARHARLEIKTLRLTAASPEAADTAILFAKLNTAVGTLLHTCSRFRFFKTDRADIAVLSDFNATKPTATVDIELTVRGMHLVVEGIRMGNEIINKK